MHQRPNRDEYVVVRENNVIEGLTKDFKIQNNNYLNDEYDYGSILHPPYDVRKGHY